MILKIDRSMKNTNKPKVYMTISALKRLAGYVDAANHEISGLGAVNKWSDGFLISEIFFLRQRAFNAYTELKSEDLAEFLIDWVKDGNDPEEIRFWWHSHADMEVFWSDIDDYTATHFHNRLMFSLVVNRSGDFLLRMDIFGQDPKTVYDIPLHVLIESDDKEKYVGEIREKVELYSTDI